MKTKTTMKNKDIDKIFYKMGLVMVIVNTIISAYVNNWYSTLGWFTALYWFPYGEMK